MSGEVQASSAPAQVQPGARFSHYEIVSKIGAGGMGDVFLARDNVLGRDIVLKFLPPHLAADETFKERFLNEARTAASLNHPNIITIYEIEESAGRVYIAMEHVVGQPLGKMIESEDLTPAQTLEIIGQVCSGLEAAHQADIVHRDIKPDNIMMKRGGLVKVLDFGLAKVRGDNTRTQVGSAVGTAAYMSPEQGEGRDVDSRSDIFSVGIVLYEMLTKKPAFSRDYLPATMYAIIHDDLPPLAESVPDIPPGFQEIIDKAMAKDPADRYPSMTEMLADINELRGQSNVFSGIRPSSRPEKPRVKSVALLCLNNLGQEEDDFLCYGISEDLNVDLTRLGQFRVAPMRSVLKYRNSDADFEEIAEKLDVDYVLDGSLMKMGESVRVSAQLVEVASGANLWADRWECKASDIPKIKSALAEGVSHALGAGESKIAPSAIISATTDNATAYEFYLRGKYTFDNKKNTADLEIAIGLFRQALSAQPSLALAEIGIAKILVHKGEYEKAISELEPVLKLSKEEDRKADAFRVMLVICEARVNLSDWDAGQRAASKALEIARDQKDLAGEAEALRLLVDIHTRRADFDEALLLFERVLEISRTLDDQDMIAEALKSAANVHFRKGEYSRARTLYEEAIAIARRRGDMLLDAKCICNIGLTHANTGNLDLSVECFNQALDMYQQVGDRTGQANAYNNLALIQSTRGSYRQAIESGEKAATIVKELGDTAAYALAATNVARYRATIGEYDKAVTLAQEALEIALRLNYPFVINLARECLGYTHYCSGEMKRSREFLLESLKEAEGSGLKREAGLALSNLSAVSYYLGDYDACRDYAKRALDVEREVGGVIAKIRASGFDAVMTVRDGNYGAGMKSLESVLEEARKLGDPRLVIATQRLFHEMSQRHPEEEADGKRAARYLGEALALAQTCEIAHEIRLCTEAKNAARA